MSPEPLAMLLPARLAESEFSLAGTARVNGRAGGDDRLSRRRVAAAGNRLDGRMRHAQLPGRSRGRVWVDAATYDVLRIDDRLCQALRIRRSARTCHAAARRHRWSIERAESSIRYARIEFENPRETMMLPVSIDTVTVIRGTSTQRVRITQRCRITGDSSRPARRWIDCITNSRIYGFYVARFVFRFGLQIE